MILSPNAETDYPAPFGVFDYCVRVRCPGLEGVTPAKAFAVQDLFLS